MKIINWTSQPEKLTAWDQQIKVVDKYGNQTWYKNGQIHRDGDKPAVIYIDGSKLWLKNGEVHRDGDQPAVIYVGSGMQFWYKNGRRVARSRQEFDQWKKGQ